MGKGKDNAASSSSCQGKILKCHRGLIHLDLSKGSDTQGTRADEKASKGEVGDAKGCGVDGGMPRTRTKTPEKSRPTSRERKGVEGGTKLAASRQLLAGKGLLRPRGRVLD